MAETFLSILLLMFISSRYFIHNARGDIEIVTQMILDHVLVQRFKKKEMNEKNNLITITCKCCRVSKFL